jgi:hypothetical protein
MLPPSPSPSSSPSRGLGSARKSKSIFLPSGCIAVLPFTEQLQVHRSQRRPAIAQMRTRWGDCSSGGRGKGQVSSSTPSRTGPTPVEEQADRGG